MSESKVARLGRTARRLATLLRQDGIEVTPRQVILHHVGILIDSGMNIGMRMLTSMIEDSIFDAMSYQMLKECLAESQ